MMLGRLSRGVWRVSCRSRISDFFWFLGQRSGNVGGVEIKLYYRYPAEWRGEFA